MTLAEFLAARITEDDEHASRYPDPPAAREIREVRLKRKILARHRPAQSSIADYVLCEYCEGMPDWPCVDVLDVAAVYSDHPDYGAAVDGA